MAMEMAAFTDEQATAVLKRALKLLAVLTVIALPLVGWKMGAASAGLLLAGAAVSAAGLWKWMRLMTVVMERMEAAEGKGNARPVGTVLVGFFLTLGLMLAVLYASLKLLDASVYALFLGLGMGIVALGVEAVRLARAWTI